MLTFFALNAKGERCSLPAPLSFEISEDSNAPADSLVGMFPDEIKDDLAEIYITDGRNEVFSGIVDEQIVSFGESVRTRVYARSMAALLLDNEAKPRNLFCPSARVIFALYIGPLGFESFLGDDRCVQGNFDVAKGMSCWQVAEKFGMKVFGRVPRVKGRSIVFEKEDDLPEIVFSDTGEGIAFTSVEHNRLRCRIISKVKAKTDTSADYSVEISNSEAVSGGVIRERYINASAFSKTPLSKAYEILKNSTRNCQKITLVCPACITNVLGKDAKVICSGNLYEGYFVKSVRYSFSAGTEKTRITLCRKES